MIYAIADLHLDISKEKDMSIFGGNWGDYENKIFTNWSKMINEDDLVIVAGDISWAMKIEDAILDLDRIEALPGKKIIMKGNHDYWWLTLNKLNKLGYKSISFLQNNSFRYKDTLIVGTRGWESRDSQAFNENDEKIFLRELQRLELSITDALSKNENYNEIIAAMHYPPFDKNQQPNEFEEIFKKYNIKKVVYGHIHGNQAKLMPNGIINGIEYFCISGDLIDFKPVLISKEGE